MQIASLFGHRFALYLCLCLCCCNFGHYRHLSFALLHRFGHRILLATTCYRCLSCDRYMHGVDSIGLILAQ